MSKQAVNAGFAWTGLIFMIWFGWSIHMAADVYYIDGTAESAWGGNPFTIVNSIAVAFVSLIWIVSFFIDRSVGNEKAAIKS